MVGVKPSWWEVIFLYTAPCQHQHGRGTHNTAPVRRTHTATHTGTGCRTSWPRFYYRLFIDLNLVTAR